MVGALWSSCQALRKSSISSCFQPLFISFPVSLQPCISCPFLHSVKSGLSAEQVPTNVDPFTGCGTPFLLCKRGIKNSLLTCFIGVRKGSSKMAAPSCLERHGGLSDWGIKLSSATSKLRVWASCYTSQPVHLIIYKVRITV